MGIAVDGSRSKLYWTNSRGRIQSANLDGSGITNVIPGGLESPMDLALAGSNFVLDARQWKCPGCEPQGSTSCSQCLHRIRIPPVASLSVVIKSTGRR